MLLARVKNGGIGGALVGVERGGGDGPPFFYIYATSGGVMGKSTYNPRQHWVFGSPTCQKLALWWGRREMGA